MDHSKDINYNWYYNLSPSCSKATYLSVKTQVFAYLLLSFCDPLEQQNPFGVKLFLLVNQH